MMRLSNRNSMSGSAATAAMLAALIVIMVAVTVYVFVANPFPSRPPATITSVGLLVDQQYFLTLCVTGVVFILSQVGLAYAIWRFRDRGQTAHFTRGSNTLEMIWTTATIVLFLGLGLMGRKAWAEVRFTPAEANAVQVEVTTNQFVFNFRYPGPDGKFGRLDPKQVSASTGNALGIDENDPAGKDDIVVPKSNGLSAPKTSFTIFMSANCVFSRTLCPEWSFPFTLRRTKSGATKLCARNSAA
jgi:cytochrome c oxidase subunit 2